MCSLSNMAMPSASAAAPDLSARRVPDFFIVGSPKSGTTSLYEMLRRRPQIYMPALKEPRFLASDMRPRPEHAGEPREFGYPTTLEDYLALFDEARLEQRVGEASTFYLWSRTAAERIHDLQPDARIIAILREPASFLRSMHLLFMRWGLESQKDLLKAISLEPARREGRDIPWHSHRPQLLQYSDHVRYVDQLARYDARFAPEQMLVLIYEDFHNDNEATVRRVLRFLEADDGSAIDVMKVNVTTRTVRSWRAKFLLRSLSRGQSPLARSTKATIKALTTRRVRHGANKALRRRVISPDAPPPDMEVMMELRRRYKPEVVALSEYLDRDLVGLWGYDEIG
jgi:Sulfotransferase family